MGLAGGLAEVADRYAESANLAMVFMLSVLVSGLAFGLWPAVTAAAAAAFVYNFFFLGPQFSLYIGHAADVFTFAVFFAVAMTTGWLTGRIRDQSRAVSRRASGIAGGAVGDTAPVLGRGSRRGRRGPGRAAGGGHQRRGRGADPG